MAFEEIASVIKYHKNNEMKVGNVVVTGWYQESRKSKFGHMDFFFIDEAGITHCINHSGHLEFLMGNVRPEEFCRITYTGLEKMTKGKMAGKDAHRFKLEIDKSRYGTRTKTGFTPVEEPKEIAQDDDLPL